MNWWIELAAANQKLDKSTKKKQHHRPTKFERQNHGITRIDSVHTILEENRTSMYWPGNTFTIFLFGQTTNGCLPHIELWISEEGTLLLASIYTTSFITIIVPPPSNSIYFSPLHSLSLSLAHPVLLPLIIHAYSSCCFCFFFYFRFLRTDSLII